MYSFKLLTFIVLNFILIGCENLNQVKEPNFSIKLNSETNIISNADTININITNINNIKIDSIHLTLNNTEISKSTPLFNSTLGEKVIKAKVYHDSKIDILIKNIIVVNKNTPKIYSYEIVNTYPHDIKSYTQGLEFYNEKLYESTGQYGESKLREIDYKSGDILKNINLSNSYFGEGLSILNNKIYQLTWKEERGLVYDINSLRQIETFKYGQSKEGWGLCNDGNLFYKSDGTEYIWLLNPKTLYEESYIQAYTNKGKLTNLNELEWVEGYIYANRYQKNGVAIINPNNGAIEAVIDFKALKSKVTKHDGLDVLNGMAYNKITKTLFVTGKRWDKLFEVRIIKN
jgi:glutamine cyclotransferase